MDRTDIDFEFIRYITDTDISDEDIIVSDSLIDCIRTKKACKVFISAESINIFYLNKKLKSFLYEQYLSEYRKYKLKYLIDSYE